MMCNKPLVTYEDYAPEVLADSPYSYWRLNEASGTTITDIGSSPHHLTMAGGNTLNHPGLIHQDTCMDNSSGQASYDLTNTDFNVASVATFEAWVNLDYLNTSTTYGTFLSAGNFFVNPYQGWRFAVTDGGKLAFSTMYNSVWRHMVTTTAPLSIGATAHVVCVVDMAANTVDFYVNGQFLETVEYLYTIALTYTGGWVYSVTIGAHRAGTDTPIFGYLLNGRIDEVAFYKAKLAAARILAHYNAGKI